MPHTGWHPGQMPGCPAPYFGIDSIHSNQKSVGVWNEPLISASANDYGMVNNCHMCSIQNVTYLEFCITNKQESVTNSKLK